MLGEIISFSIYFVRRLFICLRAESLRYLIASDGCIRVASINHTLAHDLCSTHISRRSRHSATYVNPNGSLTEIGVHAWNSNRIVESVALAARPAAALPHNRLRAIYRE